MKINYNISAIIANTQLGISDRKLSTSMERLSSGYKINNAKDDPSGLAIAKRMTAQIRGLELSESATQTGVSVMETAEGALTEVHSMLQRMNELAIQAANGTMSDEQRVYIQEEVSALQDEIVRITSDTAFNGENLLDGSFDYKAYTNSADVKCSYYSDDVTVKEYSLTINFVDTDAEGNITDVGVILGEDFPAGVVAKWEDNRLFLIGNGTDRFEMQLTVDPKTADPTEVTIDVTGIGALKLQLGSNEGQSLEIRIPEITLATMGIANIDLTTQDTAIESIDKISNAVTYVSSVRASLGAYQNRLGYTAANLAGTVENLVNARSRIMDTDMAKEMTNYTTYQVMTQAGTAMLAQANERPQMVLQLLQ